MSFKNNVCNSKEMCRVCLKTETDLYDIFSSSVVIKNAPAIVLMECTTIKISQDDGLPSQICNLCIKTLFQVKQFRTLCTESDIFLRSKYLEENTSIKSQFIDLIDSSHTTDDISLKDEAIETKNCDYDTPLIIKLKNDNYGFKKRKKKGQKREPDAFKCTSCKKNFNTRLKLSEHQRIHADGGLNLNVKLKKTDKTNLGVFKRRKRKNDQKIDQVFQCNECNKNFNSRWNLAEHQRIHTGERPYKCDVCGHAFTQSGILTRHKRTHSGERPYKCNVCPKTFAHKNRLDIHQKIHSGERPHQCDVCGMCFTQKNNFLRHKRIHSGEKPFACDMCDKSFTQKGHLLKHRRSHTGERPYKCDVCNKCFVTKTNLLVHKRIHTGERPYACVICTKSFSQNCTLKTHMKSHQIRPKQLRISEDIKFEV